ncbi:MAG: inner membrane CreD family protein [Bryobacteraceae bacterium]
MTKRLIFVLLIFLATSFAWMILTLTISQRTTNADSGLRSKVAGVWGSEQVQSPPTASIVRTVEREVEGVIDGKKVKNLVKETTLTPLDLKQTRGDVRIDLEPRQKGLLWYSTYKVAFAADYEFEAPAANEIVEIAFSFPAQQAIYDDMQVSLNGEALAGPASGTTWRFDMKAGTPLKFHLGYRSQGMNAWRYRMDTRHGGGEPGIAQARDFSLKVHTNFRGIDFADNSLAPVTKKETGDGWDLEWNYRNLVSGAQVAIVMPEKLQPGPLAGEISSFAPVSLFFFFFVMLLITTLRGVDLHPMNYFFLAAAFFAFHLLLAYMADHVSIHAAFAISSAISVFLVVSYLRLVVGLRFAAVEAGGAQLLYLVLFSYAFFFKGYTGLTVTIGAIVTLFVAMQMTGRVKWSAIGSPNPMPPPIPSTFPG